MCKSEVEGTAPEICITLVQPGGNGQNINGGGLTVSPAVSNIEYTATTSRLRFRPCNNQPLCHYNLPHLNDPPMYGAFKLRVSIFNSSICQNEKYNLNLPRGKMFSAVNYEYLSVRQSECCFITFLKL